MIPLTFALEAVAALLAHSDLPDPLATGWSNLVLDELVPIVGPVGIAHADEDDVGLILLMLEQGGASLAERMLAHYSLGYAFALGQDLGWNLRDPAATAPPV